MWPILAQASSDTGGFRGFIDAVARTPLSQVVAFVAVCSVIRLALYPTLKRTPSHLRGSGYSIARILNEFLDAVVYAGVFVFLLIRPFAVQAFLIPSGSMNDTLLEGDFIVANKAIYRYSEPKLGDIIVFKPPINATSKSQQDDGGEVKVDFIKRCQGLPGNVVEERNGELYRDGKKLEEPYVAPRNKRVEFNWKLVQYHGIRKEWEGKYIPVVTDIDDAGNVVGDPNYGVHAGLAKNFAVGAAEGTEHSPDPWVSRWKSPQELTDEEKQVIEDLKNLPPAPVPPGYILMIGDNRNNSFDGRAWGLIPRENVIGRSECIWLPFSRWRITR